MISQERIDQVLIDVYTPMCHEGISSDSVVTSPIDRAKFLEQAYRKLLMPTEEDLLRRLVYLRKANKLPTRKGT